MGGPLRAPLVSLAAASPLRALLVLLAAASLAARVDGQGESCGVFTGDYCPKADPGGSQGIDANGCCSDLFPVCCSLPGGRQYCNEPIFGGPCAGCGDTGKLCTSEGGSICYSNSDLCNGQCCIESSGGGVAACCDGVCCADSLSDGPCCGGQCCKDSAGRNKPCCNGQCCATMDSVCTNEGCARKCGIGANNVTTYCPEPKVCCHGKCVDPIAGDPALPCKGLCCNFPPPADASSTNVSTPALKKNGWCCNNKCCTGSEKCCRGPDGLACGMKCGTKCCRKGSKCCGGRCVSDRVYCGGLCCTGSKGQPAACCTNPKTGMKSCC